MCIKGEFNAGQICVLNVHLQSAIDTNLNIHSKRFDAPRIFISLNPAFIYIYIKKVHIFYFNLNYDLLKIHQN